MNSDKTEVPQPSRRHFLKVGLWKVLGGLGVGVTAGATATVGQRYTEHVLNITEDLFGFNGQKGLGTLFKELTLGRLPALGLGTTHEVKAISSPYQGPGISINMAARAIVGAILDGFPTQKTAIQPNYKDIQFDNLSDVIFLGGALNNPDAAQFIGYDMSRRDRLNPVLPLPKISSNFRLPFAVLNGETTLGEFGGRISTARRFDEGREVERPMYRVLDRDSGKTLVCDTDNGWLASEFFQIIRLIDRYNNVKIFAWGLHGHTTAGFFFEGRNN